MTPIDAPVAPEETVTPQPAPARVLPDERKIASSKIWNASSDPEYRINLLAKLETRMMQKAAEDGCSFKDDDLVVDGVPVPQTSPTMVPGSDWNPQNKHLNPAAAQYVRDTIDRLRMVAGAPDAKTSIEQLDKLDEQEHDPEQVRLAAMMSGVWASKFNEWIEARQKSQDEGRVVGSGSVRDRIAQAAGKGELSGENSLDEFMSWVRRDEMMDQVERDAKEGTRSREMVIDGKSYTIPVSKDGVELSDEMAIRNAREQGLAQFERAMPGGETFDEDARKLWTRFVAGEAPDYGRFGGKAVVVIDGSLQLNPQSSDWGDPTEVERQVLESGADKLQQQRMLARLDPIYDSFVKAEEATTYGKDAAAGLGEGVKAPLWLFRLPRKWVKGEDFLPGSAERKFIDEARGNGMTPRQIFAGLKERFKIDERGLIDSWKESTGTAVARQVTNMLTAVAMTLDEGGKAAMRARMPVAEGLADLSGAPSPVDLVEKTNRALGSPNLWLRRNLAAYSEKMSAGMELNSQQKDIAAVLNRRNPTLLKLGKLEISMDDATDTSAQLMLMFGSGWAIKGIGGAGVAAAAGTEEYAAAMKGLQSTAAYTNVGMGVAMQAGATYGETYANCLKKGLSEQEADRAGMLNGFLQGTITGMSEVALGFALGGIANRAKFMKAYRGSEKSGWIGKFTDGLKASGMIGGAETGTADMGDGILDAVRQGVVAKGMMRRGGLAELRRAASGVGDEMMGDIASKEIMSGFSEFFSKTRLNGLAKLGVKQAQALAWNSVEEGLEEVVEQIGQNFISSVAVAMNALPQAAAPEEGWFPTALTLAKCAVLGAFGGAHGGVFETFGNIKEVAMDYGFRSAVRARVNEGIKALKELHSGEVNAYVDTYIAERQKTDPSFDGAGARQEIVRNRVQEVTRRYLEKTDPQGTLATAWKNVTPTGVYGPGNRLIGGPPPLPSRTATAAPQTAPAATGAPTTAVPAATAPAATAPQGRSNVTRAPAPDESSRVFEFAPVASHGSKVSVRIFNDVNSPTASHREVILERVFGEAPGSAYWEGSADGSPTKFRMKALGNKQHQVFVDQKPTRRGYDESTQEFYDLDVSDPEAAKRAGIMVPDTGVWFEPDSMAKGNATLDSLSVENGASFVNRTGGTVTVTTGRNSAGEPNWNIKDEGGRLMMNHASAKGVLQWLNRNHYTERANPAEGSESVAPPAAAAAAKPAAPKPSSKPKAPKPVVKPKASPPPVPVAPQPESRSSAKPPSVPVEQPPPLPQPQVESTQPPPVPWNKDFHVEYDRNGEQKFRLGGAVAKTRVVDGKVILEDIKRDRTDDTTKGHGAELLARVEQYFNEKGLNVFEGKATNEPKLLDWYRAQGYEIGGQTNDFTVPISKRTDAGENADAEARVEQAVEEALTPEDKTTAAKELGEPEWNDRARARFKDVFKRWVTGDTDVRVTDVLVALFEKVMASLVKVGITVMAIALLSTNTNLMADVTEHPLKLEKAPDLQNATEPENKEKPRSQSANVQEEGPKSGSLLDITEYVLALDKFAKLPQDHLYVEFGPDISQQWIDQGSHPFVQAGLELMGREETGPEIRVMLRDIGMHGNPSKVAWCTAFVSWCMTKAGHHIKEFGARNFLNYGRKTDNPSYGDVAIFWNNNPETGGRYGWGGHTGIVLGVTKNHVMVFNGNVDNRVNVVAIPKFRVLGYRTFANPQTASSGRTRTFRERAGKTGDTVLHSQDAASTPPSVKPAELDVTRITEEAYEARKYADALHWSPKPGEGSVVNRLNQGALVGVFGEGTEQFFQVTEVYESEDGEEIYRIKRIETEAQAREMIGRTVFNNPSVRDLMTRMVNKESVDDEDIRQIVRSILAGILGVPVSRIGNAQIIRKPDMRRAFAYLGGKTNRIAYNPDIIRRILAARVSRIESYANLFKSEYASDFEQLTEDAAGEISFQLFEEELHRRSWEMMDKGECVQTLDDIFAQAQQSPAVAEFIDHFVREHVRSRKVKLDGDYSLGEAFAKFDDEDKLIVMHEILAGLVQLRITGMTTGTMVNTAVRFFNLTPAMMTRESALSRMVRRVAELARRYINALQGYLYQHQLTMQLPVSARKLAADLHKSVMRDTNAGTLDVYNVRARAITENAPSGFSLQQFKKASEINTARHKIKALMAGLDDLDMSASALVDAQWDEEGKLTLVPSELAARLPSIDTLTEALTVFNADEELMSDIAVAVGKVKLAEMVMHETAPALGINPNANPEQMLASVPGLERLDTRSFVNSLDSAFMAMNGHKPQDGVSLRTGLYDALRDGRVSYEQFSLFVHAVAGGKFVAGDVEVGSLTREEIDSLSRRSAKRYEDQVRKHREAFTPEILDELDRSPVPGTTLTGYAPHEQLQPYPMGLPVDIETVEADLAAVEQRIANMEGRGGWTPGDVDNGIFFEAQPRTLPEHAFGQPGGVDMDMYDALTERADLLRNRRMALYAKAGSRLDRPLNLEAMDKLEPVVFVVPKLPLPVLQALQDSQTMSRLYETLKVAANKRFLDNLKRRVGREIDDIIAGDVMQNPHGRAVMINNKGEQVTASFNTYDLDRSSAEGMKALNEYGRGWIHMVPNPLPYVETAKILGVDDRAKEPNARLAKKATEFTSMLELTEYGSMGRIEETHDVRPWSPAMYLTAALTTNRVDRMRTSMSDIERALQFSYRMLGYSGVAQGSSKVTESPNYEAWSVMKANAGAIAYRSVVDTIHAVHQMDPSVSMLDELTGGFPLELHYAETVNEETGLPNREHKFMWPEKLFEETMLFDPSSDEHNNTWTAASFTQAKADAIIHLLVQARGVAEALAQGGHPHLQRGRYLEGGQQEGWKLETTTQTRLETLRGLTPAGMVHVMLSPILIKTLGMLANRDTRRSMRDLASDRSETYEEDLAAIDYLFTRLDESHVLDGIPDWVVEGSGARASTGDRVNWNVFKEVNDRLNQFRHMMVACNRVFYRARNANVAAAVTSFKWDVNRGNQDYPVSVDLLRSSDFLVDYLRTLAKQHLKNNILPLMLAPVRARELLDMLLSHDVTRNPSADLSPEMVGREDDPLHDNGQSAEERHRSRVSRQERGRRMRFMSYQRDVTQCMLTLCGWDTTLIRNVLSHHDFQRTDYVRDPDTGLYRSVTTFNHAKLREWIVNQLEPLARIEDEAGENPVYEYIPQDERGNPLVADDWSRLKTRENGDPKGRLMVFPKSWTESTTNADGTRQPSVLEHIVTMDENYRPDVKQASEGMTGVNPNTVEGAYEERRDLPPASGDRTWDSGEERFHTDRRWDKEKGRFVYVRNPVPAPSLQQGGEHIVPKENKIMDEVVYIEHDLRRASRAADFEAAAKRMTDLDKEGVNLREVPFDITTAGNFARKLFYKEPRLRQYMVMVESNTKDMPGMSWIPEAIRLIPLAAVGGTYDTNQLTKEVIHAIEEALESVVEYFRTGSDEDWQPKRGRKSVADDTDQLPDNPLLAMVQGGGRNLVTTIGTGGYVGCNSSAFNNFLYEYSPEGEMAPHAAAMRFADLVGGMPIVTAGRHVREGYTMPTHLAVAGDNVVAFLPGVNMRVSDTRAFVRELLSYTYQRSSRKQEPGKTEERRRFQELRKSAETLAAPIRSLFAKDGSYKQALVEWHQAKFAAEARRNGWLFTDTQKAMLNRVINRIADREILRRRDMIRKRLLGGSTWLQPSGANSALTPGVSDPGLSGFVENWLFNGDTVIPTRHIPGRTGYSLERVAEGKVVGEELMAEEAGWRNKGHMLDFVTFAMFSRKFTEALRIAYLPNVHDMDAPDDPHLLAQDLAKSLLAGVNQGGTSQEEDYDSDEDLRFDPMTGNVRNRADSEILGPDGEVMPDVVDNTGDPSLDDDQELRNDMSVLFEEMGLATGQGAVDGVTFQQLMDYVTGDRKGPKVSALAFPNSASMEMYFDEEDQTAKRLTAAFDPLVKTVQQMKVAAPVQLEPSTIDLDAKLSYDRWMMSQLAVLAMPTNAEMIRSQEAQNLTSWLQKPERLMEKTARLFDMVAEVKDGRIVPKFTKRYRVRDAVFGMTPRIDPIDRVHGDYQVLEDGTLVSMSDYGTRPEMEYFEDGRWRRAMFLFTRAILDANPGAVRPVADMDKDGKPKRKTQVKGRDGMLRDSRLRFRIDCTDAGTNLADLFQNAGLLDNAVYWKAEDDGDFKIRIVPETHTRDGRTLNILDVAREKADETLQSWHEASKSRTKALRAAGDRGNALVSLSRKLLNFSLNTAADWDHMMRRLNTKNAVIPISEIKDLLQAGNSNMEGFFHDLAIHIVDNVRSFIDSGGTVPTHVALRRFGTEHRDEVMYWLKNMPLPQAQLAAAIDRYQDLKRGMEQAEETYPAPESKAGAKLREAFRKLAMHKQHLDNLELATYEEEKRERVKHGRRVSRMYERIRDDQKNITQVWKQVHADERMSRAEKVDLAWQDVQRIFRDYMDVVRIWNEVLAANPCTRTLDLDRVFDVGEGARPHRDSGLRPVDGAAYVAAHLDTGDKVRRLSESIAGAVAAHLNNPNAMLMSMLPTPVRRGLLAANRKGPFNTRLTLGPEIAGQVSSIIAQHQLSMNAVTVPGIESMGPPNVGYGKGQFTPTEVTSLRRVFRSHYDNPEKTVPGRERRDELVARIREALVRNATLDPGEFARDDDGNILKDENGEMIRRPGVRKIIEGKVAEIAAMGVELQEKGLIADNAEKLRTRLVNLIRADGVELTLAMEIAVQDEINQWLTGKWRDYKVLESTQGMNRIAENIANETGGIASDRNLIFGYDNDSFQRYMIELTGPDRDVLVVRSMLEQLVKTRWEPAYRMARLNNNQFEGFEASNRMFEQAGLLALKTDLTNTALGGESGTISDKLFMPDEAQKHLEDAYQNLGLRPPPSDLARRVRENLEKALEDKDVELLSTDMFAAVDDAFIASRTLTPAERDRLVEKRDDFNRTFDHYWGVLQATYPILREEFPEGVHRSPVMEQRMRTVGLIRRMVSDLIGYYHYSGIADWMPEISRELKDDIEKMLNNKGAFSTMGLPSLYGRAKAEAEGRDILHALVSGYIPTNYYGGLRFLMEQNALVSRMFGRSMAGLEAARNIIGWIEYGPDGVSGRQGYQAIDQLIQHEMANMRNRIKDTDTMSMEEISAMAYMVAEIMGAVYTQNTVTGEKPGEREDRGIPMGRPRTPEEIAAAEERSRDKAFVGDSKRNFERLKLLKKQIDDGMAGLQMASVPEQAVVDGTESVMKRFLVKSKNRSLKRKHKWRTAGYEYVENYPGALRIYKKIMPLLETLCDENGVMDGESVVLWDSDKIQAKMLDKLAGMTGESSKEAVEYAKHVYDTMTHLYETYNSLAFLSKSVSLDVNPVPPRVKRLRRHNVIKVKDRESIMDGSLADSLLDMRNAIIEPKTEGDDEFIRVLDVDGLRAPTRILSDMLYRMNVAPAFEITRNLIGESDVTRYTDSFLPFGKTYLQRRNIGFKPTLLERAEIAFARDVMNFDSANLAIATLANIIETELKYDRAAKREGTLLEAMVFRMGTVGMGWTLGGVPQMYRQTLPAFAAYGVLQDHRRVGGDPSGNALGRWAYDKSVPLGVFLRYVKSATGLDSYDPFAQKVADFVQLHSPFTYTRGAEGVNYAAREIEWSSPLGVRWQDSLTGDKTHDAFVMAREGAKRTPGTIGWGLDKSATWWLDKTMAGPERAAVRSIYVTELWYLTNERWDKDPANPHRGTPLFKTVEEMLDAGQKADGMPGRFVPNVADLQRASAMSIQIMAQSDSSKKAVIFHRGSDMWLNIAQTALVTFSNHLMTTAAHSHAGAVMMYHGDEKTRNLGARMIASNLAQNMIYAVFSWDIAVKAMCMALGMFGVPDDDLEKLEDLCMGRVFKDHFAPLDFLFRFLNRVVTGNSGEYGYQFSIADDSPGSIQRRNASLCIRLMSELINQMPFIGMVAATKPGQDLTTSGLKWWVQHRYGIKTDSDTAGWRIMDNPQNFLTRGLTDTVEDTTRVISNWGPKVGYLGGAVAHVTRSGNYVFNNRRADAPWYMWGLLFLGLAASQAGDRDMRGFMEGEIRKAGGTQIFNRDYGVRKSSGDGEGRGRGRVRRGR